MVFERRRGPERADRFTTLSGHGPFWLKIVHLDGWYHVTLANRRLDHDIRSIFYFHILLLRWCLREKRTQLHHPRRVDLA
jgi:hypothetical protein